ncbi:MAG: RHS repeat-associated core domain-containing protein [Oscillospiraceae bacterium]|nr:RHS repeat-associated core domain-containing protein [Oscillospiraceae bacterium]
MTWKMGNQLATASKTGQSMTFSYDADGIRTSKTVANGNKTVTYSYLTQDGKVMRQEWDEDGVNYQLDFFYDTQGKPLAVIYRQNGDGLSYYYLTNQQGDVTKLYKPVAVSGSTKVNMVEIATYSYDPWGKATVTVNTGSQITNNDRTLANINPLRYRGYYQDVETGFYYLQSRYYDPVIGRFINADLPEYAALSATDITGTNLFAYCKNDPINHADEDGEWLNLVIGAVVGAAVNYVSQVADNLLSGDSFTKALTNNINVGSIVAAGFSGALSAIPGAGAVVGVVDNIGGALIEESVNSLVEKRKWSWKGAAVTAVNNIASSRATKKFTKALPKYIRDIKAPARAKYIKGTRGLTKYLRRAQIRTTCRNVGVSGGVTWLASKTQRLFSISAR